MTDDPNRAAAMAALTDWGQVSDEVTAKRRALIVDAYAAGLPVTEIAKAAGVTRDTVYADLLRAGVEFYDQAAARRLAAQLRAAGIEPGGSP